MAFLSKQFPAYEEETVAAYTSQLPKESNSCVLPRTQAYRTAVGVAPFSGVRSTVMAEAVAEVMLRLIHPWSSSALPADIGPGPKVMPHAHVHKHTHSYTKTHTHTCQHIHTRTHVHTPTHRRMRRRVHIQISTYTFINTAHACVNTRVHRQVITQIGR